MVKTNKHHLIFFFFSVKNCDWFVQTWLLRILVSSTISEQFKLTRQKWGHVQPIKHHAQTVLYADNQKKVMWSPQMARVRRPLVLLICVTLHCFFQRNSGNDWTRHGHDKNLWDYYFTLHSNKPIGGILPLVELARPFWVQDVHIQVTDVRMDVWFILHSGI